jgi:hypothetical protein
LTGADLRGQPNWRGSPAPDHPLRAAIATLGAEGVHPEQPVLPVTIRFDGVLAKPIELRLLDDRGAMTALMRYDNAPNRPLGVDLAFRLTSMFLSELLRRLLADP